MASEAHDIRSICAIEQQVHSCEAVYRYIEWCGYGAVDNPAYLDPSIIILMAAFDTLTHESPQSAAQETSYSSQQHVDNLTSESADTKQGTIAWLKSMLAFHGKKL